MNPSTQRLAIGGLALALAAALAPAARAQFDADSSAPIEITADSMEWFQEKRIAIARGNADAVQGRYRLQAETLTAHIKDAAGESKGEGQTSNKIERIDAEGAVHLSTPEETASGDTGTYDVTGKVAVLIGNVVLTQGKNVMRGERLDMDLVTGRSKLSAGAGAGTEAGTEPTAGGRVKAIFVPDKKSDEPER